MMHRSKMVYIQFGVILFLVIFVSKLSAVYLYEECSDNTGKEFIVIFLYAQKNGFPMQFHLTTPLQVSVNVHIRTPLWTAPEKVDINVTVTPGVQLDVNLPETLRADLATIDYRAVVVTASDVIVLFVSSTQDSTGDSFIVYPVDTLGTEYVAISYQSQYVTHRSQFACVATEDVTNVEITSPVADTVVFNQINHSNGGKFTVTLNKYEALVVNGTDVTGTLIASDNKLSCFTGAHTRVNCVSDFTTDFMCEHLIPMSAWSKEYLSFTNSNNRPGADQKIRVVAGYTTTAIDVIINTVTTTYVIPVRSFYEFSLAPGNGAVIRSSDIISVGQFSCSKGILYQSNNKGDPRLLMAPSVDTFLPEYTFVTPIVGLTSDHVYGLVVITDSTIVNTIELDEKALGTYNPWTSSSLSGYTVLGLNISGGYHKLRSNSLSSRFGGYIYGFRAVMPIEFGTTIGRDLRSLSTRETSVAHTKVVDNTKRRSVSDFVVRYLDKLPQKEPVLTMDTKSSIVCFQNCMMYDNCLIVATKQEISHVTCNIFTGHAACDELIDSIGYTLYARVENKRF